MNLIRHIHKVNAVSKPLPGGNFLAKRFGFWGIVISQNSKNNTVTVVSDTGFEYKNIPVVSSEWVTVDENKNYIPSTRNLPPRNSRVFVLTPTYSANGAFVLCSGFSRGDENIRTLWAKDDNELESKNNSRETKTQGGWDKTENYTNGNLTFASNDNNITVDIQTVDDTEDTSKKKKIEIKAWNNQITINADGIVIKDKTGNTINMTASDIQVNAYNSNTIKIGNSTDTLKGIFTDLITVLDSFKTAGSPANHTAVPGQFTNLSTKIGQILE